MPEDEPDELLAEVSIERASMLRRSAFRGANSQGSRSRSRGEPLKVKFSTYGATSGLQTWTRSSPPNCFEDWKDERHVCDDCDSRALHFAEVEGIPTTLESDADYWKTNDTCSICGCIRYRVSVCMNHSQIGRDFP